MAFDLDQYLASFWDWEKALKEAKKTDLGLDRMERLLTAFGCPDDKLKFVHVAGSKGKGSTCMFLASILRAAGKRVGLFTSPHLHSMTERIRVLQPGESNERGLPFEGSADKGELSERARFYQRAVDALRYDQKVSITYFEYLTALAISYFVRQEVDIVVLETGLGGRLDATNVFETMVCGITLIDREHTAILGNTLEEIALEKAGIIKAPTQKVTIAPQDENVRKVLAQHCAELLIEPTYVGDGVAYVIRDPRAHDLVFDVYGRRKYQGLQTSLLGEHQVINAVTAISMAEDLEMFGYVLTEEDVVRGIKEAVFPARLECVRSEPVVLLDVAHTQLSAEALAVAFQRTFPDQKAVIVIGMSDDKDVAAFVRTMRPIAQNMVLTRADHPRALLPEGIKERYLSNDASAAVCDTVAEALDMAMSLAGQQGVVLVCGSVFVCAEARVSLTVVNPGGCHG